MTNGYVLFPVNREVNIQLFAGVRENNFCLMFSKYKGFTWLLGHFALCFFLKIATYIQ